MSKIGESLLKGAKEALTYAKGERKEANTYQVIIPKSSDGIVLDKNSICHKSKDE